MATLTQWPQNENMKMSGAASGWGVFDENYGQQIHVCCLVKIGSCGNSF